MRHRRLDATPANPRTQGSCVARSSSRSYTAATFTMIRFFRCANAVASAGTRARAPSRTGAGRRPSSRWTSQGLQDRAGLSAPDVRRTSSASRRDRAVLPLVGRIDLGGGIGFTMSAIGSASASERRERALTAGLVAGVAHQAEDHGLAVLLFGDEGHRWRRHHVRDRRELSGASSAASMNPAMVSVVAGRNSMPPTTPGSSCRRNRKRVATPKLPPPPRIAQKRSGSVSAPTWVDLAVRRDEVSREQVVDREAELSRGTPRRRRA